MTKRRVLAAALSLIFIAVAAVACKDDDDDTTYLYLDGTLVFSLDAFLEPNTTIQFEASGVTHPDGEEITYIWSVDCDDWDDDDDEVTDTVDVFSYTFGEDLTTYTVTCKATADDYVSSSTTMSTTVVKGGLDGTGSLTDSIGSSVLNLNLVAVMTDTREDESKDYYYTAINGYDWFIQNLAYLGSDLSSGIGTPYYDLEVMVDVFGAYYSYDEAVVACPEGWKLPTAEEWDACIPETSGDLMANVYFNGDKMWEFWPAVTISNSCLFSAAPVGQVNLVTGEFSGVEERAVFWTSTEDSDDSSKAVVKYFIPDQANVYEAYMDKESFGASVRCVRQSKSSIEF